MSVSVVRPFVEYNPDSEGRNMRLWTTTCGYDTEFDIAVGVSAGCSPFTTPFERFIQQRKQIFGIGNRYDNNLQFVVVKSITRYGSYSLAGYVSVVCSLLRQQQRALCGWSRLLDYLLDTAHNGVGRLVEHANRQVPWLAPGLQSIAGSGIIGEFSRPPTLFLSMVRGWRKNSEDVNRYFSRWISSSRVHIYLLFPPLFQWHARVYTILDELLGGVQWC